MSKRHSIDEAPDFLKAAIEAEGDLSKKEVIEANKQGKQAYRAVRFRSKNKCFVLCYDQTTLKCIGFLDTSESELQ